MRVLRILSGVLVLVGFVLGFFAYANAQTQSMGNAFIGDFEFHLEGRTEKMGKLIEAAGTKGTHKLAAQCYKTLSKYYRFYRVQLGLEEDAPRRCVENLQSLLFTPDHLWKCRGNSALPAGGGIHCGITYKEWIDTFEQRSQEIGQVGAAVLKVDGEHVRVDVLP